MSLSTSLYIALAIFGLALIYKVSTWFRYKIGIQPIEIRTSERVFSALKGILLTVFSPKILTLLKVFVLDVLLQLRILKEDFLRWLMHICIYGGFMLLLLMHALDKYITVALFNNYYPTINPFMFLRNLFGVFVILGVAIAIYRRFILKVPRLITNAMDIYTIIIVAVIMLSGIFLEATKMVAYSDYQRMVNEYSGLSDPQELKALEAYWVKEFGTVSPNLKGPFDEKILAQGRELHQSSCAECHAKPQWAFAGYGGARLISSVGLGVGVDRARLPSLLWYLHVLACWVGLAYLPFSKMFHMFTSQLSLLANSVMEKGKSSPANIATRQVMELDACTHCGTCSLRCSVAVVFDEIPNINILPSEKIASIKALASGKKLSPQALRHIQEGVYLCTNCYRCTVVCPVGINLQDLWFNVRETLLQKGYPEFFALSPLSFYRGLMREETVRKDYEKPLIRAREAIASQCDLMKRKEKVLPLTPTDRPFQNGLNLSSQAKTFSVCFGCQTCTTVCPVVSNYDNPQEALGLLPHQIMHAAGLGLRDLAFGSNMLWDCLTCYQCQEQCPQGVSVTDVLYELKNLAIKHVRERAL
ncbi:MAG TPA: 4Fe-4S dicluster domain-containing protein [Thermodesulfobacteriota bacterium]|nr:4Fe-4S dicluster domain-containing protein [Thermodesulfobacteriota bacterium]